jgi:tripartite-type tricarboxylate transporter receptor subunit TctC
MNSEETSMLKRIAAAGRLAACSLALAVAVPGAYARADYPDKPIRLILPYVAGGAADITARVMAQKLTGSLGQTVIVENKPGANGIIGTDYVAKAKPDGYTLVLDASGPIVVNPTLQKVNYDPVKDLAPISQLTSYQYVFVVPRNSPFHSIDDMLAAARAAPGKITYGSAGVGSGGHLAGALLGVMTHTDLTHVPYKGNAQALSDVLSGQLSFDFDTVVTSVPHIKSGALRAYAVSGPKRSPLLPDVPTMEELGYKGFAVTQFQGLLAPAGTPAPIIARLHDEAVRALKSPDVDKRLVEEGGNEIVGGTPAEFAQLIRNELASYRKLITEANIRLE